MNHDPLAALKDLHLPPAPIDAWPAPGWIIIFSLLLLTFIMLLLFILRRWFQQRVKRQAIHLLETQYQAYLQQGRLQQVTSEINVLLKRVALFYYPRAEVANLHGQAWLDFLNRTSNVSKKSQHPLHFHAVQTELLVLPYQKSKEILPVERRVARLKPLMTRVKTWINAQPGGQDV